MIRLIRSRLYLVSRANIRSRRKLLLRQCSLQAKGSIRLLSVRLSSSFPMVPNSTVFAFRRRGEDCPRRLSSPFPRLVRRTPLPLSKSGSLRYLYPSFGPIPNFGVTGNLIITRKGISAIRPLIFLPTYSPSQFVSFFRL